MLERFCVYGLLLLLLPVMMLIFMLVLKWIAIGKNKPHNSFEITETATQQQMRNLRYQITYGFFFLTSSFGMEPLRATLMLPCYLALLGSVVGKKVYVDSLSVLDYDLLTIGPYTSINASAYVIGHAFQYGDFQQDYVHVGSGCNVGSSAQIVPGVRLKDGSSLCALSRAFNGEVLEKGVAYTGTPANRL